MLQKDREEEVCPINFTSDNVVRAKCEGVELLCLVDTGAELNLASTATLNRLPTGALRPQYVRQPITIYSACGNKAPVLGAYLVTLWLNRQPFEALIHEVQDVNRQMILGQPFLREYGARIDYRDHTLHLTQSCGVGLPESQEEMRPGEARLMQGRMVNCMGESLEEELQEGPDNMAQLTGLTGIVVQTRQNTGLEVITSLVTSCQGTFPVMVVNKSQGMRQPEELHGQLKFYPADAQDELVEVVCATK